MTASAGPVLKRLYEGFGDRVAFVTLYVREAHPGERIPQPETFKEKMQHARMYKERDQIPWPVVVDDLEGALHRALDPQPNAAYLMDADGKVAFRALWSNDVGALRNALEAVVSRSPGVVRERQTTPVPLLMGMGAMEETFDAAGPTAWQDIWRAAPPMYVLGHLAGWFRPLSPLARGVTATATSVAGLAMALGIIRSLLRRSRSR